MNRLFVRAGLESVQPRFDLVCGEVRRRRGFLELLDLRFDGLHLFPDVSHHGGGQSPGRQVFHEGVILPLLLADPTLKRTIEVGHTVLLPGLILPQSGGDLVLILRREQLVEILYRRIVNLVHVDNMSAALLGAVITVVYVPLPGGPHAVHLGPALAVHKPDAQIPGLLPCLFPLCHNSLHLHKLRLADDLWQGVLYSNGVGLAAPVLPAFLLLGCECVCAGVLLISEHFIYLGVLDGPPALASDTRCGHFRNDGGEPLPVGGGIENLAHIARFQLVDNVLLIYHVLTEWGGAAVVEALQRRLPLALPNLRG